MPAGGKGIPGPDYLGIIGPKQPLSAAFSACRLDPPETAAPSQERTTGSDSVYPATEVTYLIPPPAAKAGGPEA